MDALSLRQIAEFGRAEVLRGNGETRISRVSTDSRTIKPGQLFVALRGENFDAHNFLEQVAKAGATGAMVSGNRRRICRKILQSYAPPTRWLPIRISPPIIEKRFH